MQNMRKWIALFLTMLLPVLPRPPRRNQPC